MIRCLSPLLLLALCACVTPQPDEPVTVVRADAQGVVLRGLIDATRTEPPPRYAAMAQEHCAQFGQSPRFVSMVQQSTFAFDVTYSCAAG